MYEYMSSTVSHDTVNTLSTGGMGWTAIPSFVTTPVDPSQPLKSPSNLGMGRVLCQASSWIAQDPTRTNSPVGRTTSMLVISWLFRP